MQTDSERSQEPTLPGPPEDEVPTLEPKERLLDRYEVGNVIGRGATGYVYRGFDTLTKRTVAIKFLRIGDAEHEARGRREVTAMRVLPIPGVVEYIDDFPLGDDHVIVMELVDGRHFPGAIEAVGERRRVRWNDVRETVLALLETLARVHEMGVIHRDIKPSNVLVRPDGRPVILDFGLARGSGLGSTLTRTGARLGTPRYWAPEQVVGRKIDGRVDIYSTGVMLFEALTGELPRAQKSADLVREMVARPISLADHLPDAPWRLVRTIDRMLQVDPEARFATAGEAIQSFRGEGAGEWASSVLPRLGDREALECAVDHVRRGRSLDVVGETGSGRTRVIKDALLEAKPDRAVRWLDVSTRPFGSLSPLVGDLDQLKGQLAEVSDEVERRLRRILGDGTILIADPVEGLDRWSQVLLETVRDDGCIIRAVLPRSGEAQENGVVTLLPLSRASLEELFARFDDAERVASLLYERTAGVPARIDERIASWVRLGALEWRDGRLDGSAALQTLFDDTHPSVAQRSRGGARPNLTRDQEELLCWVLLAGRFASPEVISRAAEFPMWQLEALVADLESVSAVERHSGGVLAPAIPVVLQIYWTEERIRAAHRRLADLLPADSPERKRHESLS